MFFLGVYAFIHTNPPPHILVFSCEIGVTVHLLMPNTDQLPQELEEETALLRNGESMMYGVMVHVHTQTHISPTSFPSDLSLVLDCRNSNEHSPFVCWSKCALSYRKEKP